MRQRAAASLRHVILLQGKFIPLADQDPGDHELCRATQQLDSFRHQSTLSVALLLARWPFFF